jgi:hypothetical protein
MVNASGWRWSDTTRLSADFSIAGPITSMQVYNQGVLQTITIPSPNGDTQHN